MKKNIFIICSVIVLTFSSAFAYNVNDDTTVFGFQKEEYGPKPKSMTFSLLSGVYFNGLNQNFPSGVSKFNNLWRYGVRIGYAFNKNFEIDGNLAYTPTIDGGFNLNVYDYALNGLFNFIVSEHVVPYVTVGFGGITYKEQLQFDFTRYQLNYGGGLKFFPFQNMALAPEFRAITSLDSKDTFDTAHTAFTASLVATYYFTHKRTPKVTDSDQDGVLDDRDYCPNTPIGVAVGTNGCPYDADGDGVADYLDKCPNTPPHTQVDANGCDNDTDKDGVINEKDLCPETPLGEKVDVNGCSSDVDKDGVINEKDQCPNTPVGVKVNEVGCPLDSDGDGVPDYKDLCLDTPPNTKVDKDGCEITDKDSDRDGVIDPKDKCPNTPEGVKVDATGCPPDTDGDGIPDYKDLCPTQKEVFNGYKDEDGCPDHELDEFSGVIEGIFFETDQSTIKKESYPKLNHAVEVLGQYKILNFVIEGHTDSTGSKAHNMTLSEKRAQTVYEYLRYRGIASERMGTEGFGPTKPIADNKTKQGRAKNRRIEFRILNLDAARREAEESKKRATQ